MKALALPQSFEEWVDSLREDFFGVDATCFLCGRSFVLFVTGGFHLDYDDRGTVYSFEPMCSFCAEEFSD